MTDRNWLTSAAARREAEIGAIAKRFDLDPAKLARVMDEAADAHRGDEFAVEEGPGRSDQLDRVAELARELTELLAYRPDNLNYHRLIQELSEDDDGTGDMVEAAIQKLDAALGLLEDVRAAARAAHQAHDRSRGRPTTKALLRAAYQVLAGFWIEAHGPESFKQNWQQADGGLAPINDASRFLFETIATIDHGERLAERLRDLMIETVTELPGKRRGRRT